MRERPGWGSFALALAVLSMAILAGPIGCSPGDDLDEVHVAELRAQLKERMIRPSADRDLRPVTARPFEDVDPEVKADRLARDYLRRIRDRYIVVLDRKALIDRGIRDAREVVERLGIKARHVYDDALTGFSAYLTEDQLALMNRSPLVKYVQPDGLMFTRDRPIPHGPNRVDADLGPLHPIDGGGADLFDVTVAIIDTGIDLDHDDLNAVGGKDFVSSDPDNGGYDMMGHGTHCAGIVGALDDGLNYDPGLEDDAHAITGIAPGTPVFAVRVLDENGGGDIADIIAGINWIAGCVGDPEFSCPAAARNIRVANMSLGCACSNVWCWCNQDCDGTNCNDALKDAIDGAMAAGVTFTIAAGNASSDVGDYEATCLDSPACFGPPIVVASMTDFDGRHTSPASCPSDCGYTTNTDDQTASYSNYGDQVDIIAPGTCIESTYHEKYSCSACVQAPAQCTGGTATACVTSTPGEYYCCKSDCTGCNGPYQCQPGKDGICIGSRTEYCCWIAPYVNMSGTSMAAPAVAGGAARYIAEYRRNHDGDDPTPAQVKAALMDNGESLPCGSPPGDCNRLPGVKGLYVGEHRDSIEVTGYSVDFMTYGGDFMVTGGGFGEVADSPTSPVSDGSHSLHMGVHDTGGTVHGYSCVKFCLNETADTEALSDYLQARFQVKFDDLAFWTGFGVSGTDLTDDFWLYWWWIREDGTTFDDDEAEDRFGGDSVFGTTGWHDVEIHVDRRAGSSGVSLRVDGHEDTGIPLTSWDPSSSNEELQCVFVFSGVLDDTWQDLYVDQVYLRALPGGTY